MRLKLIIVSLSLASCSHLSTPALPSITPYKVEIRQGNLVTPEMREKIKVGMTTTQVRAALGTPLIADPFHANRWDYQYRYEQEGKLVRQQRLTLYFENDRLTRIEEHNLAPETPAPQVNKSEPVSAVVPEVVKPLAPVPVKLEARAQQPAQTVEFLAVSAPQAVTAPVAAAPAPATPAKTEAAPTAAEAPAAGQENNAEYKRMAELYRKDAEKGNAEAQYNLGQMYELGYGVPQDYTVAAQWYRKAGKQGYAKAFFNLGVMNDLGRGVNKDDTKAASRYLQAARLGDAKAQYTMGTMYAKGQGIPKDEKKAMFWYRKAAAQGNAEAQALVKAEPAAPRMATPVSTAAAPAAEKAVSAKAAKAEPKQKTASAAVAPQAVSAEEEQAIVAAVNNWAAAWSAQDVTKYLASYAPSFKPAGGMNHAAWEAQRKARVTKPKSISVELSDIHVGKMAGEVISVGFKQKYNADIYKDVTKKTLKLKKIDDKWLIVSEQASKK